MVAKTALPAALALGLLLLFHLGKSQECSGDLRSALCPFRDVYVSVVRVIRSLQSSQYRHRAYWSAQVKRR